MFDYIAALLAYIFDQDKIANPAPAEGKESLLTRVRNHKDRKEEP